MVAAADAPLAPCWGLCGGADCPVSCDAAGVALDGGTPIWDDLLAQHGPALVAAAGDVGQALADLVAVTDDW